MKRRRLALSLRSSIAYAIAFGSVYALSPLGLSIPNPWDIALFVIWAIALPIVATFAILRVAINELRSEHSKLEPLIASTIAVGLFITQLLILGMPH